MLLSGLPEYIEDQEELARFLTQRNHYNLEGAKPSAFLPSPTSRESSVSRHGREPSDDLWELGYKAAGSRNLYGGVFITAEKVRENQLDVFPDEPPPRHAAIRNWPWMDYDLELQKAKQKELALALSSAAGPPLMAP